MKILNNFVEEYKAILTMKKAYKDNNNRKDSIVKTLSLTLIMAVISILTALIFKTTENLGYLFTMLNGIVLGSFIVYRILNEIKVRTQLKRNYQIRYLIITDTLELTIILSLLTVIILLAMFDASVSYFVFISYIFVLVLSMIARGILEESLKKTNFYITRLHRIILSAIYFTLMYYSIGFIIDGVSLVVGTVLTYLLVSLIYIYKLMFNEVLKYIYMRRVFAASGMLLLILILYPLIFSDDYPVDFNPIGIEIRKHTIELYDDAIGYVVTDDEIIVMLDERIDFYSYDLELIDSIVNEGFTKIERWGNEVVLSYFERTDRDYCLNRTYYSLINHEIINRDNAMVFVNDDIYYSDGYYLSDSNKEVYYVKDNCSWEAINDHLFDRDEWIAEQRDNYLILAFEDIAGIITNEGHNFGSDTIFEQSRIMYSNDYILAEKDESDTASSLGEGTFVLLSVDDFVGTMPKINHGITLPISDNAIIRSFYYTDEYIVVMVENEFDEYGHNFIYVFDHSTNLVTTIKENYDWIVKNDLIIRETGAKDQIEIYRLGSLNTLYYSNSDLRVQVASLVGLIVMIFTVMPITFLKGGELDD